MMVRVEVRQVLGKAVDCPYPVHEERLNGMLRDRLNALTRKTHAFAKTTGTWDALVSLCLFEHNWLSGLAGSGEGPAGGAAVSAADASDGHRVDRSYLDLGRVLDLQVLSIPKGVTIDLSAPSANRHLGRSRQSTKVRRYLHRL
jgi:hypothetical protein